LSKINEEGESDNNEEDGIGAETTATFLEQLKVDNQFHDYLIKVLNQKLEAIDDQLNCIKNNLKNCSTIYDPEFYSDKELLKFLTQLWIIFWQQMGNSKCPINECNEENRNYYCDACIKCRMVYVKILSHVWKICSIKFNPKLYELFSFSVFDDSQDLIAQSNQSNLSTVAVGILDLCREYVNKCLISKTNLIGNSLKLATALLDLMYDVGNHVTLQMNDYSVLFKWTQTIASTDYIGDTLLTKSLIKFLIYTTWNKNSSAALMKYICQDLVHFLGFKQENFSDSLAGIENIFSFVNNDNIPTILALVSDELFSILSIFEWFIMCKSDTSSMLLFYKQLNFVLESVHFLMVTQLATNYYEILLKIIVKFYNFMILFCKSIINKKLNENEEKLLKAVVDFTAQKMQRPLNQFIRFIQNSKSQNAVLKDAKKKGKEVDVQTNSTAAKV
jgi:hypothetical protein